MNNQVKTGVFFCLCGHVMNDYFEVKALLDQAGRIPGVMQVDENRFLCTRAGADWLKTKIAQSGCNRVVIVGCSPYLYEQNFIRVVEESGLNRNYLAIANIREGCAWVCQEKGDLIPRARDIITAAVKRVILARPLERVRQKINQSALIIGAGLSGIHMALELNQLGIRPILIEKEVQVSRKSPPFFIPCTQGLGEREMFSSKVKELRDRHIELLTSTEVRKVKGAAGAFQVVLDTMGQERVVEAGAIVVSTGSQSRAGERLRALPSSRRIVSLSQLREMFDHERKTLERMLVTPDKRTKYVCFILGDSETFPKSASIMALNEAIILKDKFKAEVVIVARDISVSGTDLEPLYRQARMKGILFHRYTESDQPEISLEKGIITIRLQDGVLSTEGPEKNGGRAVDLTSDLLVLEDEILPSEGTGVLKDILRVSLNQWGFFQEKNIHLKPNLSNKKGIFLVGSCLGEKDIYETLNDVRSVAVAVYSQLSGGELEFEKKVEINTDKCALCLTCYRTCPHAAIEIGDVGSGQKWGARIIVEACQGCGICVGECPAKAIEMVTYSDNQIFSELTAEG